MCYSYRNMGIETLIFFIKIYDNMDCRYALNNVLKFGLQTVLYATSLPHFAECVHTFLGRKSRCDNIFDA